jgi:2-oxoglutarate ferredoxin oxidoreductase subunit alpha
MLNGNEAIALGSLSAGLKFSSFYPMTPSTSISLNLAGHARQMGLIVEQAEDEIAAINMAIGASFAGVPSMVATSGGGFALMVEGISLAAMTETPLVVVVAQRPGPATGLPTRTEQADLELVLHAGHGEFPRAIFAPGTVEECFHLTRRAFELAERYQGPIFLLTDQFLADSYRAVASFDVENLAPVHVGNDVTGPSPYLRFVITESGVSPRLLPGITEHLVVADSDEHTQDGHITEDLSVRKLMVEKRLKKGKGLRAEVIPPDMKGNGNPDLLLV